MVSLISFQIIFSQLIIFVGILQVLKFEFLKFRILEILNFHPCAWSYPVWDGSVPADRFTNFTELEV